MALDGTPFAGGTPYLVSLHKYSCIVCIDANKGILERDHMYAQQVTAAVLTPFVAYEDLVYIQHTATGFLWWARAHGNRFEVEKLILASIQMSERAKIFREWHTADRNVTDKDCRTYERRFNRTTKYSETLTADGLAQKLQLLREEQAESDAESIEEVPLHSGKPDETPAEEDPVFQLNDEEKKKSKDDESDI